MLQKLDLYGRIYKAKLVINYHPARHKCLIIEKAKNQPIEEA